ncbi:PEP-CTERM system histidine kinase PrsK [candidate division KSB1 bacterium]|nr:MAG: PEP-CTERM system histidine kinase PrsK [candidate division KSB1 bacterium]
MNLNTTIPLVALALTTVSAVLIYIKNPERRASLLGMVGVLLILLAEFATFMANRAELPSRTLFWARFVFAALCLLPANGTLFTLMLARKNFKESVSNWRGYLAILYIIGGFFLLFVTSDRFITVRYFPRYGVVYPLGAIGRYFLVFLLLSHVIILINLESTLRYARGSFRSAIKVPFLGLIIGVFYIIVAASYMLMYSRLNLSLLTIGCAIIAVLAGLFIYYLIKNQLMQAEIQVGRQVVYSSVMVLIVGGYLIFIGLVVKLIQILGTSPKLFVSILASFAVICIMMAIVASESLRKRIKTFIDRNFYRNKYDYREEWSKLSDEMSSIMSTEELLTTIINSIANIMFINKIAIFLEDNLDPERLVLRKSQNLSLDRTLGIAKNSKFLDWLWRSGEPLELERLREDVETQELFEQHAALFSSLEAVVWVPLIARRKLIGVLSLGGKSNGERFSKEDFELLEIIANQSSIAIQNAKLSEELIVSKELESFHKVSSFVIHDLKNAISMLSMMVKNSETNLNNAEFQQDMLATISNAIERMQALISRISTVPKEMVPNFQYCDLNSLIKGVIEEMEISRLAQIDVKTEFGRIPPVVLDPELIRKVIVNLVNNAIEAMPSGGRLELVTRGSGKKAISSEDSDIGQSAESGEFVEITVSDTGSGIPIEMIQDGLFKPFKTTKNKGLGIGLFQCKEIITLHRGKIEVESEVHKGTTFSIKLPVTKAAEDSFISTSQSEVVEVEESVK